MVFVGAINKSDETKRRSLIGESRNIVECHRVDTGNEFVKLGWMQSSQVLYKLSKIIQRCICLL